MVFDKNSLFNIGIIAFNIALGLHDLNWWSSIQFALAGMLVWLEVRKQLNYRLLCRFRREIEENILIVNVDQILTNPILVANLPLPIFHLLMEIHRSRLLETDAVNWKRDGF
jgi:hypothetical protein